MAIVDPHIKRDKNLYIYTEAQELDILSKTADGKEFEGWCWTGSSAWTDWFNPASWQWWIDQFQFSKFKVSFSTRGEREGADSFLLRLRRDRPRTCSSGMT